MATVKVSQPIALRIELLRAHGASEQDLIDFGIHGEISRFPGLAERRVDFSSLVEFARNDREQFERAVRHGYQIKFSTINGIKNLLSVKFGLESDRDYTDTGESLERLTLRAEDVEWLRNILSANWSVKEEGEHRQAGTVRIALGGEEKQPT
jgi:hypothetical protein